jgi:O-antigen ligase
VHASVGRRRERPTRQLALRADRENGRVARTAVAAVPLVLVPALGAVQGGFHPDTWVWAGALAAWAGALALVVGAEALSLRREWPWVALGLALLLWTLLSTLWSPEREQSLLEARRTVVYAAVVLALLVLARRNASWILVTAGEIAVTALVLYALGRYLLEPRRVDQFEGAHLSQPLGYANAVGILAVVALLLSLAPAVEARRAAFRAAAAGTAPLLGLALELTGSDASWLALAVGALALLSLHPAPSSLLRTGMAVVPLTAAAAWLGHASRLAQAAAQPRLAGWLVGVVGLALGAAAAAAVTAAGAGASPGRRVRRDVVAALAAVALAAGGAVAVVRAGATEPRSSYYHVAWLEYRAHPVLGSGAGTFGRYWLRLGSPERWGGALDAHSLYLETLAELGPVGLLLLSGFLLAPLRHVVASRGVRGVPAAAGATVAFLVHAGLDWDWELPAVVVAALACAAAVALAEAGTARAAPGPLSRRGRTGVLAVSLLLGAAAIAGGRSSAEPSAATHGSRAAPRAAALLGTRRTAP